MRSLKALLALSCIVLGSPLLLAAEPQWVEVRSPNFSVITDAGDRRGRDVALHFEQMRSVFGALMTRAKVNLPVPLQIVAFRNSKELSQVAPLFNGKPIELAGLFEGGNDRSFIILDMSAEDPWTTVFHEYAHRLMDGNLSFHVDPWFEEGFAEYFSSIEVDDKQARVGKIPEQTYRILQQMGWMKVADLFRVQQNSKTYNESGDHRTTFYAESGLVVHYLYDNLLVPKLNVYFDTLQLQKKPVEQSIQAAFGMTAEQFDKALRDYLRSGKYRYYPVPTPSGIVASQFTVTPVSAADAHAIVADIHAHSPDYRDKALGEFQDVLKMDPDNTAALRGAGFVCMEQKDNEHAAEYLRRATERDTKDARAHYYYAVLLQQQGAPDIASFDAIKKQSEMAIALDPSLADAYSLLGFTQAASGESEKGIATMKKALELSPRNERYMFNLANVYMANGKVDDAISTLQNLTASADTEIAAHASRALAQAMDFKKQSAAFRSHDPKFVEERQREGPVQEHGEATSSGAGTGAAMHFMKGKLVAVDCSAVPQAVLTIALGTKSKKVHVRDIASMVLIGADQFSCEWTNKNVAVNYRERADGDGDVVSVEIE